ncbi:MAG: hypothetical protein FWC84_01035 [Alphaproteobacteria bacterium]|nr:hypothetical protein [Alphaproteobacteria bacterium]
MSFRHIRPCPHHLPPFLDYHFEQAADLAVQNRFDRVNQLLKSLSSLAFAIGPVLSLYGVISIGVGAPIRFEHQTHSSRLS